VKIVTIKDMKAQTCFPPRAAASIAEATRQFEIVSNEGESMISRFPHDFRLLHIADFDANTGLLDVLAQPSDLGSAADFKAKPVDRLPFDKAQ